LGWLDALKQDNYNRLVSSPRGRLDATIRAGQSRTKKAGQRARERTETETLTEKQTEKTLNSTTGPAILSVSEGGLPPSYTPPLGSSLSPGVSSLGNIELNFDKIESLEHTRSHKKKRKKKQSVKQRKKEGGSDVWWISPRVW